MSDQLQYKGLSGSAHFSAEDQVFYGEILGIDDLVSFHGDSVKALTESFHEAVDEYLETCAQLGKEPGKIYKGSFNIRITPELHRDAAVLASGIKISLNDFVKSAIEYAIENKDLVITKIRRSR